jgi:Ca-activated chloride channel homolog
MPKLMRCLYCGLLQDEPKGVKECQRCGGELAAESVQLVQKGGSYLMAQMELDQVNAPAGQTVDRHLLITLRTPEKVPDEHAVKTDAGRPPISFHAVVDVSGSMSGEKIQQTKQALRIAARTLREGDQVSMTLFSNQPQVVMKPTKVGPKTRQVIESVIDEIQVGGMTALYGGLELGIQQATHAKGENMLVLLLSDGQANVGETDLEKVGFLAAEATKSKIVVSTLGVGEDYNEALMTEIATQGRGRFYHVQTADQIVAYLTGELGEAADLAARDVKIQVELPQGSALIPLSAAYKSTLSDGVAVVSIGDIPADLEVEIPLRLTLFSGKEGARLGIEGSVAYQTPAGGQLETTLNQVTVRFVKQAAFKPEMGVIKPVAERVAHQMRAAQVMQYSRAFNRGDPDEQKRVEQERLRLRDYMNLLDDDIAQKMTLELDADVHAIRSASPLSKKIASDAYRAQRFMRDINHKK